MYRAVNLMEQLEQHLLKAFECQVGEHGICLCVAKNDARLNLGGVNHAASGTDLRPLAPLDIHSPSQVLPGQGVERALIMTRWNCLGARLRAWNGTFSLGLKISRGLQWKIDPREKMKEVQSHFHR